MIVGRALRHEGGAARIAVPGWVGGVVLRFVRFPRPTSIEGRTVCTQRELRAGPKHRHRLTALNHEGLPPRFAGGITRLVGSTIAICATIAPTEPGLRRSNIIEPRRCARQVMPIGPGIGGACTG